MSRATFIASISGNAPPPPMSEIVRRVSWRTGVSVVEILGINRQRRIVQARHMAMLRGHEAGLSLTEIGSVMRRDHTTVINGIRRAKERKLTQRNTRQS